MTHMNHKGMPADCEKIPGGTSCLIFQQKSASKKFCMGCVGHKKVCAETISELMRNKKGIVQLSD